MDRAEVNGITLEYEVQGTGEPVVFIHGALIADTFAPMMAEPALKDFKLIRYRRRGHAGSGRGAGPASFPAQAADCLELLRSLDAVPAHVVGHSGGGVIALQFALDAPEAMRSLTLLEPALLDVPSGPKVMAELAPVLQAYTTGDKPGAVDAFLQAVCGKGYRQVLDRAVPGGMEQAVADADTFFGAELASAAGWVFTEEDAARIKQPVLSVLGENSDSAIAVPFIGEIHERVLNWFPQAKPFVLPRATHFLQMENPHDMAVGLAGFLHSVRVAA